MAKNLVGNGNTTNLVPIVENIMLFSHWYSDIHGWLTTTVCSLGLIFNLMIIVAMSKNKKSSVQTILISIACTDSITMALYLPYSIHFYILNSNHIYSNLSLLRDTLFWTHYSLARSLLCDTFHSMSVWFTVYLSVYRYFYMKNSMNLILCKNKQKAENSLVKFLTSKLGRSICLICLFCFLFTSPKYLSSTVREKSFSNVTSNQSDVVYFIDQSDLNKKTDSLVFKVSFYSHAIFGKILPSILLGIFISLILHSMLVFKRNKQRFRITSTQVTFNFFIYI